MSQTPSKIPTATRASVKASPVGDSPKKPKRRTRVSELLARLSNSSSHRARVASTQEDQSHPINASSPGPKSPSETSLHKTLIPVAKLSASVSNIPSPTHSSTIGLNRIKSKDALASNQSLTSHRTLRASRNSRRESTSSIESATFFPRIPEHPPAIPRPLTKHHSDADFKTRVPSGSVSGTNTYANANVKESSASLNRRHSMFANTEAITPRGSPNLDHRTRSSMSNSQSSISPRYSRIEPRKLDRRTSIISVASSTTSLQNPPIMPLPQPEAKSNSNNNNYSTNRRSVSESTILPGPGSSRNDHQASTNLGQSGLTGSNSINSGSDLPAGPIFAPNAISAPNSRPTSRVGVRPSSRVATRKRASARIVSAGQPNTPLKKLQATRMEELKTKIKQLEDVLSKDNLERRLALEQTEQIQVLQQALDKERQARLALESLLKSSNDNIDPESRGPNESNFDSQEKLSIDTSRTSDLTGAYSFSTPSSSSDDHRKSICTSISNTTVLSVLSDADDDNNNNQNQQESKYGIDLVALQTEVSVLTADNRTLKSEKERLVTLVKQREEDLKSCREELINTANDKDSLQKAELALTTQVQMLEKELKSLVMMKDEEIERLNTLNLALQHESTAYQISRKQLESRVANLESIGRRNKRYISALEVSLQDLKISLEERAMENDELNWSITKVMEQANQTIEDAKRLSSGNTVRHSGSVIVPSPPTSPMASDASSLHQVKIA